MLLLVRDDERERPWIGLRVVFDDLIAGRERARPLFARAWFQQLRRDVARGEEPLRRIFLEALENRALEPRRHVRTLRADGWRERLLVLHREADGRIAAERHFAAEELVEKDAEGVDVAAGIDALTLELLGRHVVGRADDDAGRGDRVHVDAFSARDAEIEQRDAAVGAHHHVVRLHVAMDDADRMRRRQRLRDPRADARRVLRRQHTAPAQHRAQIFAFDQLRGEVHPLADHAPVEDAHDTGMLDARENADLAAEAHRGIVFLRAFVQHLQRAQRAVVAIAYAIHGAHSAASERVEDLVTAGEKISVVQRHRAMRRAPLRRVLSLHRGGSMRERNRAGLRAADRAALPLVDELEAAGEAGHQGILVLSAEC